MLNITSHCSIFCNVFFPGAQRKSQIHTFGFFHGQKLAKTIFTAIPVFHGHTGFSRPYGANDHRPPFLRSNGPPGFYQVWQVIATFRRLWHKQRGLHDLWDAYLASFAGCLTDGPFGKLLEIFDQLGGLWYKHHVYLPQMGCSLIWPLPPFQLSVDWLKMLGRSILLEKLVTDRTLPA